MYFLINYPNNLNEFILEIRIICKIAAMSIDKKDKFIQTPVFLGDGLSIKEFVKKHLKYPPEAFKNKIEATVHVRYAIDSNGDIIEAKNVGTAGYGLDEEAIRVVKLMKYSKVRNRNLRLTFNRKIDIHFRMPKPSEIPDTQKKPTQLQLGYTFVPSVSKPEKDNGINSGSYSYNISIE